MMVKLETEGVMMNVVSGFALQEMEEKEEFLRELDEVVESIPRKQRVVTGADFRGYAGKGNRGDGQVWCQGKELGMTDCGGSCRKKENDCGENLPEERRTQADI